MVANLIISIVFTLFALYLLVLLVGSRLNKHKLFRQIFKCQDCDELDSDCKCRDNN